MNEKIGVQDPKILVTQFLNGVRGSYAELAPQSIGMAQISRCTGVSLSNLLRIIEGMGLSMQVGKTACQTREQVNSLIGSRGDQESALGKVRIMLNPQGQSTSPLPESRPIKEPGILSGYSRSEIKDAETRAAKLTDILGAASIMSMERPGRIREIAQTAALTGDPVMVINWICPAGTTLQPTPDGKGLYKSFAGVDPVMGLQKDYRLTPRLDLERDLLRAFERSNIPLWYIKLVADDNLYCLYPYTMEKDGETESMRAIKTYAEYAQEYLNGEFGDGKINAMTVSDFLGAQRFRELVKLFESTPLSQLLPYLPPNIIDIEKDVITKHTQMEAKSLPLLDTLVDRVIRQYACEGLIIREMLEDNVVVAWNESTRRAATIDAARKAKGMGAFPKFFVLHRKKGSEVEQDY